MKTRNIIITALALIVIAGGIYLYMNIGSVQKSLGLQSGSNTAQAAVSNTTVQIQPASAIVKAVSASGNIELVNPLDIAMQVGGTIKKIDVQAGDVVTAGQVLLSLDIIDLERAVAQAQVAVDSQTNKLAQFKEPPTAENLATAQENLKAAQAALANLQSGPSKQNLAAAQAALTTAQAKYNDLVTPLDQNQITQLSAAMKEAQSAVAVAQTNYNKVKWHANVGMSAEGAALQQATIAYESAKAAYEQATLPPTAGAKQAALSAIQSAKEAVANLTPTAASIASAQAQVTSAQSALDTLNAGSDAYAIKGAELALQQATVNLQQAQTDLAEATVKSPISGTVLSVVPILGQQVGAGTIVAAVADLSQLQLTVNVAEVDISQLKQGQEAQITLDAFPGRTFKGQVSRIIPTSTSTSGVINYPVTILLTDDKLGAVRPGMTAVASMSNAGAPTADEWFVPTNAIQKQNGATTIQVVRNSATISVPVTPGQVKGDWTEVKAAGLQADDQAVGSVTTKIEIGQPLFRIGGRPGG